MSVDVRMIETFEAVFAWNGHVRMLGEVRVDGSAGRW